MITEILALGLSNDKERIGVKTALCFGLVYEHTFQGDTSVVVLFVFCLGVLFVLLAPYVCFIVLVKVTEWPPIGKIAAHSAYDMFHGMST